MNWNRFRMRSQRKVVHIFYSTKAPKESVWICFSSNKSTFTTHDFILLLSLVHVLLSSHNRREVLIITEAKDKVS